MYLHCAHPNSLARAQARQDRPPRFQGAYERLAPSDLSGSTVDNKRQTRFCRHAHNVAQRKRARCAPSAAGSCRTRDRMTHAVRDRCLRRCVHPRSSNSFQRYSSPRRSSEIQECSVAALRPEYRLRARHTTETRAFLWADRVTRVAIAYGGSRLDPEGIPERRLHLR